MTSPTPLDALIRATIARSGPMPVSRYMELCLTHPEFGYYVTRSPIGRDGDFTTAPEVSQMFGELIGLWAASIWNEMGMPEEIQFVELGPGRGTMMADALRAIRILPALQAAVSVHLVELSPVLRTAQRATLGEVDRIHWYDRLDDVPARPSIIFANEYFDALPVHQAVKCEHGWCERVIDVADDQLVYGVAKEPLTRFDVLLPPLVRAAPNGAIYEWRQDAEVMSLARRLRNHGGAALIIDYGHSRSEAGDTFQAVARHNFADPLQAPGKADLTAQGVSRVVLATLDAHEVYRRQGFQELAAPERWMEIDRRKQATALAAPAARPETSPTPR